MGDETEYRVPVKVLTNRDAVIGGKLSIRELAQWGFFAIATYFIVNHSPLQFQYNLGLAAMLLMGAVVFIHATVNGLTGLEWLYIKFRYRLERKLHQTEGATPVTAAIRAASRPKFTTNSTSTTSVIKSSTPVTDQIELALPAPANQPGSVITSVSPQNVPQIKELFNKPRTMKGPITGVISNPVTVSEETEDKDKEV